MKHLTQILSLSLAIMLFLAGCASEPAEEIKAAGDSIEAAMQAGAETYATEDIKSLQDKLTAAVELAKSKSGKFLASNKEAKDQLVQIQTEADALVTTVATREEEAITNASSAIEAAKAAVEEAKTLLANAPRGKGTRADIEAFTNDLTGLEASLPDAQKAIDDEDYLGAIEKANTIKDKAVSISDEIKQAMEKTAAARKQG